MKALVRKLVRVALPACALLSAAPASAHHSFAMFDIAKIVAIEGTVKEYSFKMPHVWIYLTVPSKTGGPAEEWGFECHSPNVITRRGWSLGTLKPGDKISMRMHPMKNGSKAGSVIDMVLPNGKTLWNAPSLTEP